MASLRAFTHFRRSLLVNSTSFKPVTYLSQRKFTKLWAERTLDWLENNMSEHMENESDDYPFQYVPFLLDPSQSDKALNRKRELLITPMISQTTSPFLIQAMIDRKYNITAIANTNADLDFIKMRFKFSSVNETKNSDGSILLENDNPKIRVEQREVNTFKPLNYESFDVIFDEQPLLEYESNSNEKVKTTVFGHSLSVGGVLYVQTEAAKDFKERQELMKRMEQFYPSSHFVLVESRRLTWNRQFLYLKADSTC